MKMIKRIKKSAPAAILFILASSAHSDEKNFTLCSQNETVLFNCNLKTKTASLCLYKKGGATQYRFGKLEKIELKFPEKPDNASNYFYLSTDIGSSISQAKISFSNGIFSYHLYDITNEGDAYSGIVVKKSNKIIANLECKSGEASITQAAYEELPRENFDATIELVK